MSNKAPKNLKNAAPLPLRLENSAVDHTERQLLEDIERIQQDIVVLSQRIAESKGENGINGDSSPASSILETKSSQFVSTLRALADSDRRPKDLKSQKITAMNMLLEKVSEYNRFVLTATAPIDIVVDGQTPVRRKSFGSDLTSLPSQLRLIDRIFDLHAQSKRVSVVRVSDSASSSSSSLNAELIELKRNLQQEKEEKSALSLQLSRMSENLNRAIEESVRQHAIFDEEKVASRNEIHILKNKLDLAEAKSDDIDSLLKEIAELKSSLTALEDDRSSVQNELKSAMIQLNDAQMLHSDTKSHYNAFCLSIKRRCDLLLETEVPLSALSVSTLERETIEESQCELLKEFQSSLHVRLQSLQSEATLLLTMKEGLENDLLSVSLQRDLIRQDYENLQEQHEALRAAYNSQSYELVTSQSKMLKPEGNDSLERLREEAEEQKNTIRSLENTLQLNSLQLRRLEQWPALVAELESKVDIATKDKSRLETLVSDLQGELADSQRQISSLRKKLRDLCMEQAGTTTPWNDSYEEVMQEELQSMKTAFEARLRAMREENETSNRKQQQEISRLLKLVSQK